MRRVHQAIKYKTRPNNFLFNLIKFMKKDIDGERCRKKMEGWVSSKENYYESIWR